MSFSYHSNFFREELEKMQTDLAFHDEKIDNFEVQFGCKLGDYEKNVAEENIEWEDYFEWRSLVNKKRILTREIRRIEKKLDELK